MRFSDGKVNNSSTCVMKIGNIDGTKYRMKNVYIPLDHVSLGVYQALLVQVPKIWAANNIIIVIRKSYLFIIWKIINNRGGNSATSSLLYFVLHEQSHSVTRDYNNLLLQNIFHLWSPRFTQTANPLQHEKNLSSSSPCTR